MVKYESEVNMVELERLIKEDVELDKLSDTKLNELILEKYGIDFNEYGKSTGKENIVQTGVSHS